MISVVEADCACWHWFYDRDSKTYKEQTQDNCTACKGTGVAKWLRS